MAQCKACGARILWGLADQGKTRIPLDLSAPVYGVVGRVGLEGTAVTRLPQSFVSHFAVCPQATAMSKKGAKK